MSGRSKAEVSAARWRTVWRMRDRGTGQRAIARELGVSLSTVQGYLAKGRPATDPLTRPAAGPRSGSPRVRDAIIAGTVREVRSESVWTVVAVQCGRCGHQQDTGADSRTSTCKQCGRVMRLDQAAEGANVVPMRRKTS